MIESEKKWHKMVDSCRLSNEKKSTTNLRWICTQFQELESVYGIPILVAKTFQSILINIIKMFLMCVCECLWKVGDIQSDRVIERLICRLKLKRLCVVHLRFCGLLMLCKVCDKRISIGDIIFNGIIQVWTCVNAIGIWTKFTFHRYSNIIVQYFLMHACKHTSTYPYIQHILDTHTVLIWWYYSSFSFV